MCSIPLYTFQFYARPNFKISRNWTLLLNSAVYYSHIKIPVSANCISDKEAFCDRDKYISDVIENFSELGKNLHHSNDNLYRPRPKWHKPARLEMQASGNKKVAFNRITKDCEMNRKIFKNILGAHTREIDFSHGHIKSKNKNRKSEIIFDEDIQLSLNERNCNKSFNSKDLAINEKICKNTSKIYGSDSDLSHGCIDKKNAESKFESNIDKEIQLSVNEKNYDKAFDIFETYWKRKLMPSFNMLRKLTAVASFYGHTMRIKLLQEAAESCYPKEFSNNIHFSHYFCEATFREGDYSLSLSLLREAMKSYQKNRNLKETASYIMKQITEAPEELAEEAFHISCNFITQSNQLKPAFSLWRCLVQSKIHRHHQIAKALLDICPTLLDSRSGKVNKLINEAYLNDNIDLLHRLIECFLKTANKEHTTAAASALLSLYCLAENVNCATEVTKFVHCEQLILSKNSLRLYMHLLYKQKLPIPMSVLAFKYRFRTPVKPQPLKIKEETESFRYTFD